MFLVTDLTEKFPHTTKINDTKTVGNVITGITGITGMSSTGEAVQIIASRMRFGDEFICRPQFKVRCTKESDSKNSVTENITAVANRLLEMCMDDYASQIWAAIGETAVYDILACTDNGDSGISDIDVAQGIGRVIAEQFGFEV